MQLTEKHREYWSKNLRITAILLFIWFVVTFVIGLLREGAELQLLRMAVRVLHGRAGLADHLRDHHLVLRAVHESAWTASTTCTRGMNNGRSCTRADERLHRGSQKSFNAQLKKVYTWYTGGFIAFVIVLAIAEQMGLPRNWIGYVFLLATVGLYAGIGVMSRTSDAPSTTSPDVAFRRCSTAWRPAPTGCPPPRSSAWPARST